jgi:hypothetical protein
MLHMNGSETHKSVLISICNKEKLSQHWKESIYLLTNLSEST